MKKSLLSAPKGLQRMLLRLQKFDLDVSYRRGTEMHMADPLSRAYLPLGRQDIVDTQEVWNVADTRSPTEVETEYVDMAESVPIRKVAVPWSCRYFVTFQRFFLLLWFVAVANATP